MLVGIAVTSCSVQQFSVNTETQPFENGGKIFGEKTRDLEYKKTSDLHIIGINVQKSDVGKVVKEMKTNSYTIETKSNLWLNILTMGLVDYKVVKVINREN